MNTLPPAQTPTGLNYPASASALMQRPEEAISFIIFGASGDLTGRKLIPALYNLACDNLLPKDFTVFGFAMTPMDDESFRAKLCQGVKDCREANRFDQRVWDQFVARLHYVTADFTSPEGYQALAARLDALEQPGGKRGNRLFYLATPPSFYADIVSRLGEFNLTNSQSTGDGWSRVIIEKPFGRDLASALDLNLSIHKSLKEEQIYRIDHYLGKETVQNILAFRFANSIIEPIWDRRYVDHVQITAAETLGVEHRGGYYEQSGCLRDMFQNHLLQLLAIVAMDPPVRYGGSSVRDRKADVMKAIVPINPESLSEVAVRGQYGPGVMNDKSVPGYRQEEGVDTESKTETFAALKLYVDNWRWADVPFYLRSGKRMPSKVTEVCIQFKRVPHLFFNLTTEDQMEPNVLTMRIQPDEGIALRFGAKVPGPEMHLRQVQMNFSYSDAFKVEPSTAYETLLLDAMEGDPTLFNRADQVEMAWTVIEPLLDIWHAVKPAQPFPNYAAGTWGPSAADALMTKDGRAWRNTLSSSPSPLPQPTVHVEHRGEPMGARRLAHDSAKIGDGESRPGPEGRTLP